MSCSPPFSLVCRETPSYAHCRVREMRPYSRFLLENTGLQRTDFVAATGTNPGIFSAPETSSPTCNNVRGENSAGIWREKG